MSNSFLGASGIIGCETAMLKHDRERKRKFPQISDEFYEKKNFSSAKSSDILFKIMASIKRLWQEKRTDK